MEAQQLSNSPLYILHTACFAKLTTWYIAKVSQKEHDKCVTTDCVLQYVHTYLCPNSRHPVACMSHLWFLRPQFICDVKPCCYADSVHTHDHRKAHFELHVHILSAILTFFHPCTLCKIYTSCNLVEAAVMSNVVSYCSTSSTVM